MLTGLQLPSFYFQLLDYMLAGRSRDPQKKGEHFYGLDSFYKVRCKFRNVGAVEMSGSYKHPRVGRAWAF